MLAKPLRGPNCTLFDVYNATDYVIPALELIDARCHNIDPETQRRAKCSTPSPTTPPTPG
ncbi:2-oxo-hepta-3-ene-1,7-dioic acid hydratase [Klebsiella pneumoniae]|uniref:2-oxo-hepta-3-ene-1,7-dioic acid hydratase n=1 Tax=Klebsiella pneumoniae TaxID=573 RepID=A0A377UWF1_KLEPN|nr:2-oxo-hepta-3-ene-1,7-dioic acid hydratase [Klebsiella pneumoniae]